MFRKREECRTQISYGIEHSRWEIPRFYPMMLRAAVAHRKNIPAATTIPAIPPMEPLNETAPFFDCDAPVGVVVVLLPEEVPLAVTLALETPAVADAGGYGVPAAITWNGTVA